MPMTSTELIIKQLTDKIKALEEKNAKLLKKAQKYDIIADILKKDKERQQQERMDAILGSYEFDMD